MAIHLRSADELEKMHRAGLIVHQVLTALREFVRPGLTTMDLEKFAGEKIAGKPGKPAFKGYRGYPCSLCTSVNSEIVHGTTLYLDRESSSLLSPAKLAEFAAAGSRLARGRRSTLPPTVTPATGGGRASGTISSATRA